MRVPQHLVGRKMVSLAFTDVKKTVLSYIIREDNKVIFRSNTFNSPMFHQYNKLFNLFILSNEILYKVPCIL